MTIHKVIKDATLHSVSLVAEDPNPDYGVYPVEYLPYGVPQEYIDKSLLEDDIPNETDPPTTTTHAY